MAGTEAVGLSNTESLSEYRYRQSLSAVSCEVTGTSASSCWDQDALSTVLCALMSPVSFPVIIVTVVVKYQVQNAAARLVSGTPRREHITPVLRELHWSQ